MKNHHFMAVKKLCACLLVAVLLFSIVSIDVAAATPKEAVRMNVMLVIDGSGSLTSRYGATDPNGLRYDAIDLFLALLTNSGNHVGALVFDESSEDFLLDAPVNQINGKDNKLALSQNIRKAGTDGDTNIGGALLKGVNDAAAMSASNGLPAVVILFSDGRTDVKGDKEMQASLNDKEAAIVAAQDAEIPIYTICLAANDVADPMEMQEIAERTSGVAAKVEHPEDLTAVFEAFYSLIFASTGSEIQEAGYDSNGKLTFEVPIPAYGAEEVNIILNNTELVDKKISHNGTVLSDADIDAATMTGGYYDVIKIIDPDAGNILLELTGIPESSVTVNVLYNIDSAVQLSTADGRLAFDAGETVTLQANLIQNGNKVLDSHVTQEYTAELTITNPVDGTSTTVEMTPDSNGTFTYNMVAEESSSCQVQAALRFGHLYIPSNQLALDFDNPAPVSTESLLEEKITVLYFFNADKTYELSEYFSDAQGDPLHYAVVSSQLVKDTVDLDANSGTLTVHAAKSRSGDLVVQATDPQGASARMTIRFHVTNLTLGVSLGILGAALIALIVVGFIVYSAARKPWRGVITVTNLTNHQNKRLVDFRGSLKLKKFGLGRLPIDGKFVTSGHGRLEFVSKKPVCVCRNGMGGNMATRVSMTTGEVTLYADQNQTAGITVKVEPTVKAGGMGFGFKPPKTPPQTPRNNGGFQSPF